MTHSPWRRAPGGARRRPRAGAGVLAVPGGAVLGFGIGWDLGLFSAITEAFSLRGSGFETWFGFAQLEIIVGACIGLAVGTSVGVIVGAATALCWAVRLRNDITAVIGCAAATAASTTVLVLAFGANAQVFAFAAFAIARGSAGVVLLTWVAGRSPAWSIPIDEGVRSWSAHS